MRGFVTSRVDYLVRQQLCPVSHFGAAEAMYWLARIPGSPPRAGGAGDPSLIPTFFNPRILGCYVSPRIPEFFSDFSKIRFLGCSILVLSPASPESLGTYDRSNFLYFKITMLRYDFFSFFFFSLDFCSNSWIRTIRYS